MSQPDFDRPPGLEALFDLSFTRFLTIGVVRIIYILGILLLVLGWLVAVIGGFVNGFGTGLLALIFATIVILLELLFLRVWLELIVVLFRIGENTSAMARGMGVSPPTGGFPVTATAPQTDVIPGSVQPAG
jgi:hypothetical protein